MSRGPGTWLLGGLALAGFAGCTGLLVSGRLPDGARVEVVAQVDEGTPFAVDASGRHLAFVRGGLTLLDLDTRATKGLGGAPLALAWSGDGARLAASFAAGEDSTLKLFDAAGTALGETRVGGRLTSLAFAGAEVLGGAVKVSEYSFGVPREEFLVRWSGSGSAEVTSVGSATLKPATWKRLRARLSRGPVLAVAPLGDEVAYGRFRDPPAFAPYQSVVVRHLATGVERELGRMAPEAEGPAWAPDSGALWIGDDSHCLGLDHETAQQVATLPAPCQRPAVSPGGTWVATDGRVFQGQRELVRLTAGAAATFAASGLFVQSGHDLYRTTTFVDAARTFPSGEQRAWLLELRRLLALGLITPNDMKAQLTEPKR